MIIRLTSAKVEVKVEAELGNILKIGRVLVYLTKIQRIFKNSFQIQITVALLFHLIVKKDSVIR